MKRQISIVAAILAHSILSGGHAEAGLVLTVDAPGVQTSQVSGVKTETFDSIATGRYTSLTTAVGTLTSPGLAVVNEDQYGGAGGTGHYFAIGAESSATTATLTLTGTNSYFGFWWSAADALNSMELLSGGKVIASFNPSTALGSLGSAYYGNPNGGGDSGEKFAYLNFIGTDGTTFDQILFNNSSTGTGFEADNFSIAASAGSGNPGTPIGGLSVVPAPPAILLTSMGLICLLPIYLLRGKRSGQMTISRA